MIESRSYSQVLEGEARGQGFAGMRQHSFPHGRVKTICPKVCWLAMPQSFLVRNFPLPEKKGSEAAAWFMSRDSRLASWVRLCSHAA